MMAPSPGLLRLLARAFAATLVLWLAVPALSIAQDHPDPSARLRSLLAKRFATASVETTLTEGANGLTGGVLVSRMWSKLAADSSPPAVGTSSDPEEIARDFVTTQLGELYALPDWAELRLTYYQESVNHFDVRFGAYIGEALLDRFSLGVFIGRNGRVTLFSGDLVPFPPELEAAAEQPRLSEDEVEAVVLKDLGPEALAAATRARRGRPEKPVRLFAIQKPPYMVYRLQRANYDYEIDALSGEILSKQSAIQY